MIGTVGDLPEQVLLTQRIFDADPVNQSRTTV